MAEKVCIFHHPFPVVPEGKSGSQVRPYKMLEAFENIGYEVESVTGYAKERRQHIRRILREVEKGRRFSFVYSESHTMPTLLTELHHLPTHPGLDNEFLRRIKRSGATIGLFYRDVYWRFELYKKVAWYKRFVAIPLYWYDWLSYRRLVDHLFIPSLAMRSHLPSKWSKGVSALPPGANEISEQLRRPASKNLKLFYVGGVTPPLYNLAPLFENLKGLGDVKLTLCCREQEWEQVKRSYELPASVRIIHESGQALSDYYADADLFCLIREPDPYLDFAMPVKIFEAISYGLPIVISANSAAADFVEKEAIGWTTARTENLKELLRRLRDAPKELEYKRQHVLEAREKHTWEARALQVAQTLEGYKE